MIRALLKTAFLALLILCLSPHAQGQGTISFKQAAAMAQKQVPGGQLVQARVEQGGTVYGFYFYRNGILIEVEISITGKVVKLKDEANPNDIKDISQDVLTLLQKYKGRAKLPTGRLLEIAADNLKQNQLDTGNFAYGKVGKDTLVFKYNGLVLDARTGKVLTRPKDTKETKEAKEKETKK